MSEYRNPVPTVDIIIELVEPSPTTGIVLIERKYEPQGWAIPGGFVDYGEPLWVAAKREAKEETGLEVELVEQFYTYSDPSRDRRKHTISTVFLARAVGTPRGADDAKNAAVFSRRALPAPLVFDHSQILADYFAYLDNNKRPLPSR